MCECHCSVPHKEQARKNNGAINGEPSLPVHGRCAPRNSREARVAISSKACDSRVSAVRGHGKSTSIWCATRPGCGKRVTIREERNTASLTECVTKRTVHFCSVYRRS